MRKPMRQQPCTHSGTSKRVPESAKENVPGYPRTKHRFVHLYVASRVKVVEVLSPKGDLLGRVLGALPGISGRCCGYIGQLDIRQSLNMVIRRIRSLSQTRLRRLD